MLKYSKIPTIKILEDPLGTPRILVGQLYDFGIIFDLLVWIRYGGRTSRTFTT